MKKTIKQYEELMDQCKTYRSLAEKVLTTPIKNGGWSIREIIGHLYGWDQYNLQNMVPYMCHGADLPAFPNHDDQNVIVLNGLKDKTVFEIIDLFLENRKELIQMISSVNPEDRFTIGGKKRAFTAESFLKIFVKHDAHHEKQIKQYLAKSQQIT
ncbi:DinB family protein [Alkalicoccobacillus gibsonii]|uniref:DinB family protein n=1 Tax=Alkalicoccobacillus gibsonii TaxID=79881 RepID=UPI00351435F6